MKRQKCAIFNQIYLVPPFTLNSVRMYEYISVIKCVLFDGKKKKQNAFNTHASSSKMISISPSVFDY